MAKRFPSKVLYRNHIIARTSFGFNVRTLENRLLTNPPVETYEDAKIFIDKEIEEFNKIMKGC